MNSNLGDDVITFVEALVRESGKAREVFMLEEGEHVIQLVGKPEPKGAVPDSKRTFLPLNDLLGGPAYVPGDAE